MVDKYEEKFIKAIEKTINDKEGLLKIINRIYEDGFLDGQQELRNFNPDNI